MALGLEGVEFWKGDPEKLSPVEQDRLDDLFARAIMSDFPGRSRGEVNHLVRLMRGGRTDPNSNVGGLLQRGGQEYARPIGAMAIKKGLPIAYLGTADNTSSRLPGLLGLPEIKIKLRLDRFVTNRWHWLGSRALRWDLRGSSDRPVDTSRTSILDVLAYLSSENRQPSQPVSSYPWESEIGWCEVLTSWGLVRDNEAATEPIWAFGQDKPPPVKQEHWTTNSVSSMRNNIISKPGAREAIDYALENLTVEH